MTVNKQWRGVVVDLIPVSVYQGKTHTQDVRIELDDGLEVTLHDGRMMGDKGLIGKDVRFGVAVNTFNDVEVSEDEKAIVPVPQNQGPYATITGEVVKMEKTDSNGLVVVDLGFGTVEMDLGEILLSKLEDVSEHDVITLYGANLQLRDIEPVT